MPYCGNQCPRCRNGCGVYYDFDDSDEDKRHIGRNHYHFAEGEEKPHVWMNQAEAMTEKAEK